MNIYFENKKQMVIWGVVLCIISIIIVILGIDLIGGMIWMGWIWFGDGILKLLGVK